MISVRACGQNWYVALHTASGSHIGQVRYTVCFVFCITTDCVCHTQNHMTMWCVEATERHIVSHTEWAPGSALGTRVVKSYEIAVAKIVNVLVFWAQPAQSGTSIHGPIGHGSPGAAASSAPLPKSGQS